MRIIFISLIIVGIFASFCYAQTGADVSEGRSDTLDTSTAGNDTAVGGNVTYLNLSVTQSTSRWQGYFGNASGTLSLGYGSDIFYDFSSAGISSVFATQNQTFDFSSLESAAAADIDSVWGYADGSDQATDIFTGTTTVEGVSAPSVTLEPAASEFNSSIFDDGNTGAKSSFAFGVNVQEPAALCFDGTDCEYELMVPASASEIYYFFLTIS